MFKKLKKAVIGSEQRLAKASSQSKEYSVFSNSDTSSGDDSFYLPSAPEPTIREKHDKSDAILNQLVLNLGGDLGIMSLEQDTGYSEQESIFDNTTSATFYTTAIEGVNRTLQADQTGQTIMDKSSSDGSTVPSLNNSFESQKGANVSTIKAPAPTTKAAVPDSLEDCLAAFGGLKIKSQTNTPIKPNAAAPTSIPTKLVVDEEQNLRRLSDGSSFLVIDWDSNGQPVEHTLHYLPKTSANAAENKPPADSSHNFVSQKSESNQLLLPSGMKEQLSAMDEYSMIETPKVFAPQEASDLLFSDALDVEKPSLPTRSQNDSTVEECNTHPTLPSTTTTYTASNRSNDKYKDTLPQLVLPISMTSSLDSTPFLTPEAEIADKISDPFDIANKTVEQLSSVNANTSLSSDSGTINDSQTSVKLSPDSDKALATQEELEHSEVPEIFLDTQNTVANESLTATTELGYTIGNHESDEDTKAAIPVGSTTFKDAKNQPENSDSQELSSVKGSYSLDFSKLDSLDYDPFQSTKGLSNSPSDFEKETFTQKPAAVNQQSQDIVDNSGDFLADLLSGMSIKSNVAPKAFPEDEISEDSSVSTDRLAGGDNNLTHKYPQQNPDATSDAISNMSEGSQKVPVDSVSSASDIVLPPVNRDAGDHSSMKQAPKLLVDKEEKPMKQNEITEDVPSSKGMYSLDFSQFNDPNYNPFQTSKGLSNSPTEEPINVVPVVSNVPQKDSNEEYLKDKVPIADNENKLLSSKDNMPEYIQGNTEKMSQDVLLLKHDETVSHSTLDDLNTKSNIDSSDQYENVQSTRPCGNTESIPTNLLDLASEKALMHKSPSSTDSGVLISPEPKPETALENITNEAGNEEERPLAPKGAYSIDFSLVDNPNYDPFQTSKGLSNSPTQEAKDLPEETSIQAKDPILNEDTTIQDFKEENNFSAIKCDDDNLKIKTQNNQEGFKMPSLEDNASQNSDNQITNCEPMEIKDPVTRSTETNLPENEFQSNQTTTATEELKNVPLSSKTEESITRPVIAKEVIQSELGSNLDSEESLPVKGAYSIDFSQFDDPNFDPFQTKTGVGASMEAPMVEKHDEILLEPEKSELLPIAEPKKTSEASPEQSAKMNNKIKPVVRETDPVNVDDEPIMPKGAYSIDFSKFDDPNLDPFQTKTGVGESMEAQKVAEDVTIPVNSENKEEVFNVELQAAKITQNDSAETEPCSNEDESLPSKGSYSIDFSKFNDPNFDPFQTKTGVGDSMEAQMVEKHDEILLEPEKSEAIPIAEPTPTSKASPKESAKKHQKIKPVVSETDPVNVDDQPIMPKGAYSIDFSQFDDPNFDPFQTKTGVGASMEAQMDKIHKEILPVPEKSELSPIGETIKTSGASPEQSAKKNKKIKPVVSETDPVNVNDEPIMPKGAYSMDFSKFNDPNFDPFQTKTGVGDSMEAQMVEKHDEILLEPEKSEAIPIVEPTPTSKASPKQSAENKEIVKKEKSVLDKPDPVNADDEPLMPKGSYSIDFSQFDDPNFDPFQTKTGVGDSMDAQMVEKHDEILLEPEKSEAIPIVEPTPTSKASPKQSAENKEIVKKEKSVLDKPDPVNADDEPIMPKGAYSIDFSQFDDPNFDPFQTKTGVGASKEENMETLPESEQREALPIKEPTPTSKVSPKQSAKKNKAVKKEKPIVNETEQVSVDDQPIMPKGAYSIDFSQFDDPNFDPFQTKTGVGASMEAPMVEKHDEILLEPEKSEAIPIVEPTPTSKASPKQSAKKKKAVKKEKPIVNETGQVNVDDQPIMPKGAYSIDFSQFDDPNYDPFQTKTGVGASMEENMETLPESEQREALPIKEPTPTSKVSPKQSAKKKKIVKKEKPIVNETAQVNVDDQPIMPKGSYSIDFSQFDDPNFDPFQTKTGVGASMDAQMVEKQEEIWHEPEEIKAALPVNKETTTSKPSPKQLAEKKQIVKREKPVVDKPDPVNPDDEPIMPKGSYSIDFSQFDDPKFDPFQTKTGVGASMEAQMVEKQEEILPVLEKIEVLPVDKETTPIAPSPKQSAEKKMTVKKEKPIVNETEQVNVDDQPIMPKGSYSIDFSQFDDPNFDPFQTKTGVGASMDAPIVEKHEEISPEPENSVALSVKEPTTTSKASPKQSSKKKKTINKAKPVVSETDPVCVDDEPIAPKGAYSIDFSQFDDPNFDPFQTKTGVGGSMDAPIVEKQEELLPVPENFEALPVHKETKTSKTSKASPKQSAEKKQIVKKEKPAVNETEPVNVDDEPIMPKGSYSIDFSKFDDPNFDPFQTKTGVGASMEDKMEEILPEFEQREALPVKEPTPTSKVSPKQSAKKKKAINKAKPVVSETDPVRFDDEPIAPKGSYSIDFSKFDDPNFDPFQTKTGVGASMDAPIVEDVKIPTEHKISDQEIPAKESTGKGKPKHSSSKKKKTVKQEIPAVNEVDSVEGEDAPIMPKGSYSIDFSKFDDPNFDPFQTKTGVGGSVDTNVDRENESPANVQVIENENKVATKPKLSGKKKSAGKKSKPKPKSILTESEPQNNGDEPIGPKGAYTIDFSQFDDPNYNPFQNSKGLGNSPTKEVKPNFEQDEGDEKENVDTDTTPQNSPLKKKRPIKKKITGSKSLKLKQEKALVVPDESAEEVPLPKGDYSIDFSQFEDPNFNPFKVKQYLSNDDNITCENESVNKSTKLSPENTVTQKVAAPAVAEAKMAEHIKQPAKSFPDKSRFSDVASHTSSDSDVYFDAVSNDGRNSRNELDNTLTNDKSLNESIKSECYDVFQPADDVINSAQGLSGWDDLFNKEEAKSNALQESDLRKQSLYVKFDPLVESRKSMHRNMLIESGDAASAELLDFVNNETIKQVDPQPIRRVNHQGGDMTSFEPQYHPAASQLARNMTGENEWDDVVETPTGKLLDLSFSPKEQLDGRTTFSSVKSEVQSTQLSRRIKEVSLEEVEAENSALLKRKDERLQNILKRKELDRIGSSLQEKNAGMRTALEETEVEHQQVLNEFISAKRMFDDYQRRANELIPIIAAHKKASQDLEKKYKSKMETLRSVREKHFTLNKEANTVKTKLETEVNEVKSAEHRRIQLLEARLKKGQMMVTSLQAQLKDKITENEELTKICDELFANADK